MQEKIEKISKIEVASRLTNHAVKMFFHNDDPISTHVVVCAANEILSTIIQKKGLKTALGPNSFLIQPDSKKEWIDINRRNYNFFKHANRDFSECIDFNIGKNYYVLFENINFLKMLDQSLTKDMQFFIIWLITHHPNILQNEEARNEIQKIGLSSNKLFEIYDDAVDSDLLDWTMYEDLFNPM